MGDEWETNLGKAEEELTATLDDNSSDVKCDVVKLEKLLDKYSQVLHPCHYLITAIKRYLLYGYASSPGANPGPELLTKKLSFAMDILKQYDIVSPGLTKERGLTLFEVFRASFSLAKLEFQGRDETGQLKLESSKRPHVMEGLAYCQLVIEEAIKCLSHEKPGSFEDMVRQAAVRARSEANNMYQILKGPPASGPLTQTKT